MERVPLADELVVVDDRSTDDTAGVAAGAGADVVPIEKIHLEHGDGHGKGNVLWASLLASHGDLVVWIDGDITSFEPWWIGRLVAPLLDDPSIALVKAFANRPQSCGGQTAHASTSTSPNDPPSRPCAEVCQRSLSRAACVLTRWA